MEHNPGQCTFSFVFYEAMHKSGELVKKKLVFNVETIVIINGDSLRYKLSEGSANLYLKDNLYNKDAEFIFTSNGYDTLKTKRKMESPWLTLDVFLTKKKNEDE
jgi:DNA-dependent RNA polymerase auxiliary subunit epsilon